MAKLTDQINQSNYNAPSLRPKKSLAEQLNTPKGAIPSAAAPRPVSPTPASSPAIPSPEQAQDRKSITDAISKNELAKAYESESKQLFSPEEQQSHTDFLNNLEEKRAEAAEQYKAGKNQNEWMEVAETIGQALTQFGAGMYGQKHGVDMSGLQFNKTDWQSKLDSLGKDLDRKTRELSGQREEAVSQRDKDTSDRQKLLDRLFSSKQKDLSDKESQAFRTLEREAGQDFRASEASKDRAFRAGEQSKRLAAQGSKEKAFKPGEGEKIDHADARQERNLLIKENRVLSEIQKELEDGASPSDVLDKYKKSEHLPMIQSAIDTAPARKGMFKFMGSNEETEKQSIIDTLKKQIQNNKETTSNLKDKMVQLKTSPSPVSSSDSTPKQSKEERRQELLRKAGK